MQNIIAAFAFSLFAIIGTYCCYENQRIGKLWWPAWIVAGSVNFLALIYYWEILRLLYIKFTFGFATLQIESDDSNIKRGQELRATYIVNGKPFSLSDIQLFFTETQVDKTTTSKSGNSRNVRTSTLFHHTFAPKIEAGSHTNRWEQAFTIPIPKDVEASMHAENCQVDWVVRCTTHLRGVDCEHEFSLSVSNALAGEFSKQDALLATQSCEQQANAVIARHGIESKTSDSTIDWHFKRFRYPLITAMSLIFGGMFFALTCSLGLFVEAWWGWFWILSALITVSIIKGFLRSVLLIGHLRVADGVLSFRKGYLWLGKAKEISIRECPNIELTGTTKIGNRRLTHLSITPSGSEKPIECTPYVWGDQIAHVLEDKLETALLNQCEV